MILNNSAESSDDDADGNADVEDEPDLPVGVAIKRLRKVFKVHACCSYTNCPHVRESGFWNRGNFCPWNKGFLGFGIRDTTQVIRNPKSH